MTAKIYLYKNKWNDDEINLNNKLSNYYTSTEVDNKLKNIDLSAYAKATDLNSYLKIADANNKYLTKTDAANTYSSKNESSNLKMTFVTNITKATKSKYDKHITYNFNKSIDHYFIYGIYRSINGFECIYNNGTGIGTYWGQSSNSYYIHGTMSCSANSITLFLENYYNNMTSCDLRAAVIIYPAIYGDVTIS